MIRILTICSGNVCRSPLAAQILQSRLDSAKFQTESFGTSVMVGDHMPEEAQRISRRLGVTGAEEHRAVALTPDAVSRADVILGMERRHRRKAAQLHPTAARSAFTLLEFAHIVSEISDEQLTALFQNNFDAKTMELEAVARMRGVVSRLATGRLYDIEDPYGRSQQVFERSAKQIETAVDHIVAFFDRTAELTKSLTPRTPKVTLQLVAPKQPLQLSKPK